MGIGARTQLFLFGNGQRDILACPGIDLKQVVELNLLPQTHNMPSIDQLTNNIADHADKITTLRRNISGVKEHNKAFREFEDIHNGKHENNVRIKRL